MNYDMIKNFPTSRNGKAIFGILCAVMARLMINQGFETMPTNPDGALMAFLMAGLLIFSLILAIVRFDTGRPLFESLER